MAKTLTQLMAALGDWLNLDTTELPDSVRTDIINLTKRTIMRKNDLRFGETSDTFATVVDQQPYALPTGWSKPHSLWYTDPVTTNPVFLIKKEKDELDDLFPDLTDTDLPTHYAIWGSNILLGKVPDQIVTINRNFYRVLPDYVTTSLESDAFNNEAWEVLLFNSFALAEQYGIEDERISTWVALGKQMLDDLVFEHERSKGAGYVNQAQEPG